MKTSWQEYSGVALLLLIGSWQGWILSVFNTVLTDPVADPKIFQGEEGELKESKYIPW